MGRYDCTVTSNDKRIAWQWVQGKLFDSYERATETVIPSLAGWFLNNRSWNFWVNCEDKSFLAGEIVNRFTIDNFADLSLEEIIDEIRAASGKITTSTNLGILLIFRLYALLSRLLTDSPPSMSITLVGKNAVDVAKIFLRTMQCANFDIFNLDSDNISWIEKRVLELQDTPVIFVCSDPANRTTQSRLEKIKGWLGSGYIAGRKVTTPFIFCLKTFSPKYLFEHSILIFTDDIKVPYNFTAFAKLQNFVVSKIETGGLHWADELKKQYLNLSNKEEESVLTVGKAIVLVLFEILDLDNDSKISFQQIFDLAFWEIKKQLLMEQSIILEEFKNGICELFENGVLVSSLIKKESFIGEKKLVYYDDEYYYFTNAVLQFIGRQLKFDRKALLFIRHELVDRGFVKQYHSTISRSSELNVEIFVGTSGERKKVFAIKRIFWDSIGGIALYERGEQ